MVVQRNRDDLLSLPSQVLVFASHWSDGVDEFRLRYTTEPIVAISSRVEAAIYGDVKQVIGSISKSYGAHYGAQWSNGRMFSC